MTKKEKFLEQGYGKNFKFEVGDKVIYKGNNESATIKDKEFFGGVYFYNIVFDTGIRQDDVREMDLEVDNQLENIGDELNDLLEKVENKFVPPFTFQ